MLLPHGYATYAVGKWHLTPEDECHAAASRARWPLGRGFERFYGFMSGETHQFVPNLIDDNHLVRPPASPEEGYHLTEDLVDKAVAFVGELRAVDPTKPFFMYFCPGACHSPHQSPAEWVERYAGRFDQGWDVWREETLGRQLAQGIVPPGTGLSPRPEWVPAWDSLSTDERRLYARYMEAFAGFLSHTDHHLGRLLAFLGSTGDLENTVVVVLSDNGASSEGGPVGSLNDLRLWNGLSHSVEDGLAHFDEIGGPRCHNNYPWGWTVAGNTPFKRWKREVHEGGIADPLIVHWPRGLAGRSGIRRQYVHAIDLAPTILDIVGMEAPDEIRGVVQSPLHGTSFKEALYDAEAPSRRTTQYFEMFGSRSL
jgi:arylsulfatase